jgi:DNA-binding transcriptional LysR family regulator
VSLPRRNFRKAAARLHVSQPALSKQVRELEEELGVRLFERHCEGARLTPAGMAFLLPVRRVMAALDRAVLTAREAGKVQSDTLTIGQVGYLASGFLPESLAMFRRKCPGIDVKLYEMRASAQLSALQNGTIDIGLTVALDRELPRTVARTTILETKVCIAVGRSHPLVTHSAVSLEALAQDTILCFRDHRQTSGHAEMVRDILKAAGVKHRPIRLVGDYEPMIALIVAGYGVTIVPPLPAALEARGIVFKSIRESLRPLTFELKAIWCDGRISSHAQAFLELLKTAIGGD